MRVMSNNDHYSDTDAAGGYEEIKAQINLLVF